MGLTLVEYPDWRALSIKCIAGVLSIGFIASSNYIINEVLDAPFDRLHPLKCLRPVPSGRVNIPLAYAQWIAFLFVGLGLGALVNATFGGVVFALWVMGCFYNFRPFRTKDVPYLDVLSESVNNPLRLLAGYYIINPGYLPPISLLLSYWMIGSYFMALKRFAEYRELADPQIAGSYRKSFRYYNEENLLTSILFYGSAAMLFLGAFIIRYRIEWIIAVPLIALVMAIYLNISFKKDSAAQAPEKLYRERGLVTACAATALLLIALLFVDIPFLHTEFKPTLPVSSN